jgi:hypothetical protein
MSIFLYKGKKMEEEGRIDNQSSGRVQREVERRRYVLFMISKKR